MSLPAAIAAAVVVAVVLAPGSAAAGSQLSLIDDFSGDDSSLGTRWEGFTDRVMGGVSQLETRIEGSAPGASPSTPAATRGSRCG